MADNVLGTLFQSIADAIRNKTGDTGKIVPADFPNEINSIVVGSGGSGGTETGVGDLKIANGSFNAGTGYRKTITHGLGKMPDLVVVWYAESGDADEGAQHAAKMVLSFSMGLHSSMAEVTSYKGYYHYFGFMGLDYSKHIDDPSSATSGNIYCPDDNTFTIGKVDDGSNTAGNGLLAASGIYNWLAISGMGGSIGVVDDRIKYVTFMNGTTELFRYPIMAGDDCPDPSAQGHISTPTKESTAQYDYTFSGWSLTDGGSANSNALTNVTEDRVVYVAFSSAVRYYTVTYYDEDGTTVLKTESLAYGAVPNYKPTKEGVAFGNWTPTPVPVTGDASYTAVWSSVLAGGTLPTNASITWSVTNTGLLTISGPGELRHTSTTGMPWYSYLAQITDVVMEGVTELGARALMGLSAMRTCKLSDTLEKIDSSSAFQNTFDVSSDTVLVIPASVTNITYGVFSSSKNCNVDKIVFEDPTGWTISGVDPTPDLSDPTEYLKTTYSGKTWTKS